MNGVPLPVDAPSVAAELHRHGYRTALIGKAHFEPFMDPFGRFTENMLARSGRPETLDPWADGTIGPHRGFDHLEFATHGAAGMLHYAQWLGTNHPEAVGHVLLGDRRRPERERRRRRRHRRPAGQATTRSPATGTTPTGWPTARSRGSTASTPTTTGSAG